MDRSTRKLVRFARPFHLPGVAGEQPSGTYEVETLDEQLDGLSFVAYRRISTTITLQEPTRHARQVTTIDPADLAAALEKDAEAMHGQPQV